MSLKIEEIIKEMKEKNEIYLNRKIWADFWYRIVHCFLSLLLLSFYLFSRAFFLTLRIFSLFLFLSLSFPSLSLFLISFLSFSYCMTVTQSAVVLAANVLAVYSCVSVTPLTIGHTWHLSVSAVHGLRSVPKINTLVPLYDTSSRRCQILPKIGTSPS